MKRELTSLLLGLTLALAGVPAEAQFRNALPGTEESVAAKRAERGALEAQLADLKSSLEAEQKKVGAGTSPPSVLLNLQNSIALTEARLRAKDRELASEERLSRMEGLRRPVVVQLRDASVRQAAQAISQASGIPIGVDDQVPTDARLTMAVQAVPLSSVLEAIGRQTNLMIAADPRNAQGFVLKPWPSMEVNGQKQVFAGTYAPWSDELGPSAGAWSLLLQSAGAPYGTGSRPLDFFGRAANEPYSPGYLAGGTATPIPGAGALSRSSPLSNLTSPGWSGQSVYGALTGAGTRATAPLALTTLGDRTVVTAQPGTGPQGEPGVWLTIYRLDGNQLRKVGSTFDRAEGTGARSSARPAPRKSLSNVAPAPAAEPRP